MKGSNTRRERLGPIDVIEVIETSPNPHNMWLFCGGAATMEMSHRIGDQLQLEGQRFMSKQDILDRLEVDTAQDEYLQGRTKSNTTRLWNTIAGYISGPSDSLEPRVPYAYRALDEPRIIENLNGEFWYRTEIVDEIDMHFVHNILRHDEEAMEGIGDIIGEILERLCRLLARDQEGVVD